jgi:transposase
LKQQTGIAALDIRLFHLIATVIDACDQQPNRGPGHPSSETIRVVATLRRFLRRHALAQSEGHPGSGQWIDPAPRSGALAERGLLAKVHALLAAMLRGHPDLILDTCSVRAKRGGDLTGPNLTGPNPTDRAKRGTKYHIATDGEGVPVACLATAANVNDTLACERLFLAAFAVMARIRTVFADQGYDAEHHRKLCRAFRAEPSIHKRGQPRGSALGQQRWPVERSNAWVLENRRLALRYDRLGFIIQSLLQAACIFLVANRLASQF